MIGQNVKIVMTNPGQIGQANHGRAVAWRALAALCLSGSCLAGQPAPAAEVPIYDAELLGEYSAPEARQGVAVDAGFFYVAENASIAKYARDSGEVVARWRGDVDGPPLIHLDSLVVYEGRLYAAHSNYPGRPMTSSVEIWDAATLEHVGTHSFGIDRGSFTWLDRHAGFWWGAFANYDKIQEGESVPYGETDRTQVVRMDDGFSVLEAWTLPSAVLDRMRPMSNSGGSWGPDGLLYLTGHDRNELYAVRLPRGGSELEWIATVRTPGMEGQGIAFDRFGAGARLWAIIKKDRRVLEIAMPAIREE